MKKFLNYFIVILLILFYSSTLKSEGDFLNLDPSVRSTGMGGASVSVGNSIDSFLINPALNNTGNYLGFSANYVPLEDFLNMGVLTAVYTKAPKFNFGIGVINLFYNDLQFIDLNGNHLNKYINQNDLCVIGNTSYLLSQNSCIGINTKFVHETIYNESDSKIAFDLGASCHFLKKALNLGISLKNLNFDNSLPHAIQAGSGYTIKSLKHIPITLSIDWLHYNDENFIMTGCECKFINRFFIRCGYKNKGGNDGFKGGAGLLYNDFQIDYALESFVYNKHVHHVSISIYLY